MKKASVIIAVSVSLILSSCKKEYVCECFNPGGVFKTYAIKDTKKDAKEQCDAYSKEYQDVPFSETGCTLK